MPVGQPVAGGSWIPSIQTAPNGQFLYVGDSASDMISIFSVDSDTGALTALNSVSTPGLEPTQMLMTAGGFLFVLSTVEPQAQSSVCALNTFAVDPATGALTPTGSTLTFPPSACVFSFVATADGRMLYVFAGNGSSNSPQPVTLTAYRIDPTTGALTAGSALTWTTTFNNTSTPDEGMAIDPLGRYLYLASYQGTSWQPAITVLPYAIDPTTGALTPIGTGTQVVAQGPMVVDPSGRYLYVLDTLNWSSADHTVTALAIDQSTGEVSVIGSAPTGGEPSFEPNSIVFAPGGQFMYVANNGGNGTSSWNELAGFSIGASASSAGQPIPTGLYNQLPYTQTVGGALAVVE